MSWMPGLDNAGSGIENLFTGGCSQVEGEGDDEGRVGKVVFGPLVLQQQ